MKLVLSNRVPRDYNAASFQEIVRLIEEQSNLHAEGKLRARHGAMTAAPTSGNWEKGDFVWNSTPSAVSDAQSDYVIIGWMCTTSGTPGTWKEVRGLSEGITTATNGAEASATGVAVDFTGIPSWVKWIIIQFVGVSTNGTSPIIVQIGDSGGPETTGYSGAGSGINAAVASTNYTNGFGLMDAMAAAVVYHGAVMLSLEDSAQFTWVSHSVLARSDAAGTATGAGSKSLSAALDRVRITTSGGTDTFDAGSFNILYGG